MLKPGIPAIFLLVSLPSLAIESVRIGAPDPEHFGAPLVFNAPIASEIEAELDLGETLSEKTITIVSAPGEVFRVSVQLETSMALGDDGPHLDLVGWKHCTTDWLATDTVDESAFRLPDFNHIDTECFPQYSPEEIREEVLKEGGQRWVDVLEQRDLAAGYDPAYVALSMVRIKIEKQVDSRWNAVTTINVSVPMGC